MIYQADAVGAAQFVELEDDFLGGHLLPVQRDGHALFKRKGDVGGLIRRLLRGYAHLQNFIVFRFVGGVFQIQPLMGKVPEVFIFGIVCLPRDIASGILLRDRRSRFPHRGLLMSHSRQGAMMGISGAKALMASSNRTWSLPLPVQPWADGVCAFRLGDLHQALGDDGARKGGAQQVFAFVHGARLHGGDDVFVRQIHPSDLRYTVWRRRF